MSKLTEAFEEADGRVSSMRVMAFELLNVALFIAIYAVIMSKLDLQVIGLVCSLITGALTGKLIQKGQENGSDKPA